MDFLNKSAGQMSDLFRTMTPGARITTGLLLAVVVISLGYLFNYQGTGPTVDMMNGEPVQAADLRSMLGAFDKAGLPTPDIRGTQIFVPQSKVGAYFAALTDNNALPQNIDSVLSKPFEGGPFQSNEARNQQIQVSKQKWLEMVIREMPNIDQARVAFVTQQKGRFPRRNESKATVSVRPTGNKTLDDSRVQAIRSLVAASIGGLEANHVDVDDQNSGRIWSGDTKDGTSANNNLYAQLKQRYERDYKQRLERLLSRVRGVDVEVEVTLSDDQSSTVNETKIESKTVAIMETVKTGNRTVSTPGPAGRPGTGSNFDQGTNRSLAVGASGGSSETDKTEDTTTQSLPQGTKTLTVKSGNLPTRVTASIGVPDNYFVDIWRRANPTEPGKEPQQPDAAALEPIRTKEIANITAAVARILPVVAGVADPAELVTVTSFPELAVEEIPEPGLSDNALMWLGRNWGTAGMVALVMFSLMMLRSTVRSAPGVLPAEVAAATTSASGSQEDIEAEEEIGDRLGRFSGTGRSLRDEVTELVQEDPDAAANILKTWIGAAS